MFRQNLTGWNCHTRLRPGRLQPSGPLGFSCNEALNGVAPLGFQLVVAELLCLFRVELEVREVEVDGVIDRALPELEPDSAVKTAVT